MKTNALTRVEITILIIAVIGTTLAPAQERAARRRLRELPDDGGFVRLFDGKTLDGWVVRAGQATYKVEDGAIVGTTATEGANTFLCTTRDYADFELRLQVKCDPPLNSGMQIRSHA